MQTVFAGKKIVIGVTGSIAAFKVAGWVSDLAKDEAIVTVVMTSAAKEFVAPLTFAALSGNRVYSEMFDEADEDGMAHINISRDADSIVIAPATANCLAKLAHGLADDLLSTTVLASRCKVIVCPAMNSQMYAHPATQGNIKKIQELGYYVIDPASGMMACKDEGQGRLAEWQEVKETLARAISVQDLRGQTVLITAGPTREPIDPARYLSNRSSGKMGYALANAAVRRGAEVILISGPTHLECPIGVQLLRVQTALEMYDAVLEKSDNANVVIKAAAVADYKPVKVYEHKVKKAGIEPRLDLEQNPDILFALGNKKKEGQLLVGFAAESKDLQAEGMKKFKKKNLDLIAINDISGKNTGFESETNQVLLMSSTGCESLPFTSKQHTADLILDHVVKRLQSNT